MSKRYYAVFTIYNGTDRDYEILKRLLEKAGFSKTITHNNIKYWLPPHTYCADSSNDKTHVCDVGINCIKRIGKDYSVFVVESAGSTWVGLKRA